MGIMKFYFLVFSVLCIPFVICVCPNNCRNNEIPPKGQCGGPGKQCTCGPQFSGLDCSELSCKENYGEKDCNDHGVCDHSKGVCTCYPGYTGRYCKQLTCPVDERNKVCSNHGICVGSKDYNKHFTTEAPTSSAADSSSTYTIAFPAIKNPTLSFPSNSYGCLCNSGYSGYDCSVKECPKGAVDNKVNKKKVIYTVSGSFSDNFEIYLLNKVEDGIYRYESVSIKPTYTKDDVERVIMQSGVTNYVKVEFVSSDKNTVKESSSITLYFPGDDTIVSTKTDSAVKVKVSINILDANYKSSTYKECSGLGNCVDGECQCFENPVTYFDPIICQIDSSSNSIFTDGNSEKAKTCAKHGDIFSDSITNSDSDKHQYCKCFDGYEGALCDRKLCSKLPSWFGYPKLSECNNRGLCDENGNCKCLNNGFINANGGCSTIKCPNDCNNHGKCVYDSYNHFTGLYEGKCECNELWEGVECNNRKCPYGPDPAVDYLKESDADGSGQSYTKVTITFDSPADKKYRLVYRNRVASEIIEIKKTDTTTNPSYEEFIGLITRKNVLKGKIVKGEDKISPTADSNKYTYILKLYYYCLSRYNRDTGKDEGPEIDENNLILEYYDDTTKDEKKWKIVKEIKVETVPKNLNGVYDCFKCSNAGKCNENTGECECFDGYTSSNRLYGDNGYTKGYRADCSAPILSANPEEDEL